MKNMYITKTTNRGKIIEIEFCIKLVLTNFEDSSKKTIDTNPNR